MTEKGKIETVSDGFIKDMDGKFKKIANEIARKIINEENFKLTFYQFKECLICFLGNFGFC